MSSTVYRFATGQIYWAFKFSVDNATGRLTVGIDGFSATEVRLTQEQSLVIAKLIMAGQSVTKSGEP